MRKSIFIIILVLVAFQSLNADDEAYMRAKTLINRGLGANYDEILDSSRYLTPKEKNLLWERFSMEGENKALVGLAVNFFLGFGVGSYVIGDIGAGILGTVLDLGSYGVISVGYFGFLFSGISYSYESTPDYGLWVGLLIAGAVMKLGSTIYQLVSPFTYTREYDQMLAEALRLASATPLGEPFLAFREEGGLDLGIRLAL